MMRSVLLFALVLAEPRSLKDTDHRGCKNKWTRCSNPWWKKQCPVKCRAQKIKVDQKTVDEIAEEIEEIAEGDAVEAEERVEAMRKAENALQEIGEDEESINEEIQGLKEQIPEEEGDDLKADQDQLKEDEEKIEQDEVLKAALEKDLPELKAKAREAQEKTDGEVEVEEELELAQSEACEKKACQNGAKCTATVEEGEGMVATCECLAGYKGVTCEENASSDAAKAESPMVGLKADFPTPSGLRGLRRLAGTILPNKKWPQGRVTYQFAPEVSSWMVGRVKRAMKEMEAKVPCISFQEGAGGVRIQNTEEGCFSTLGRNPRKQVLNLGGEPGQDAKLWCNPMHTIKHEIMHTLGVYHTHVRSDRDQHVIVDTSALADPKNEHNFNQASPTEASNYELPYDYDSVMHYPSSGLSIRGRRAIIGKTNKIHAKINAERGNDMSPGDIELLKRMYGCSTTPACSSYSEDDCLKDHAYECEVDKDGKCVLKKEEVVEDDDDEEEEEEEDPSNLYYKLCPNKDKQGNYTCPYPYYCETYDQGESTEYDGADSYPNLVGKKVCKPEWYASMQHFDQCLSELPKDDSLEGSRCGNTFLECLNRTRRMVQREGGEIEVEILQPGLTKAFQDYIKKKLLKDNEYTSNDPFFKRPCNDFIFANLDDIFLSLVEIDESRDDVWSWIEKDGFEIEDDFAIPENY